MDPAKIEEQLKAIETAIAAVRAAIGGNTAEEENPMVTPDKPAAPAKNSMQEFLG